MDALQALLSRVSPARLAPDEPDPLMIEQILAAGLRAADHGRLRPWKFLVVRGEARHRFGELLADGLKLRNPDAGTEMLEAERNKALRAPVIVIVMAVIRDNPNIPEIEQIVSAGRGSTEHARRVACPRPWRILAHRRGRLRSAVQEGAGRLGEGRHRRRSLPWKSGDGGKGERARSRGRGRRMERASPIGGPRRREVSPLPAGQPDPREVLPRVRRPARPSRAAPAAQSCRADARFCLQCGQPVTPGAGAAGRSPTPETYTPRHLAEKILTSKAALEGERKQVTVLFADVKGSM